MEKRSNYFITGAVSYFFILLIMLLLLTKISPSFNADDSPETVTAQHTLGIQHPPGYPLNTLAGIDLHLIGGTFTGMSPKWGCTFPPGPFDPAFPYLNPIYDACNGYEIPIPTFTVTPTITPTWTLCVSATITPTVTMTAPTTCTKAWQNVGNTGFSEGQADSYKMKIYDGMPYIFYNDNSGNGDQMKIMKFDGTNWGPVGVTSFAVNMTVDDLFIENNIPYIAYSDNYGLVTVMKYDGSWEIVGNAGFANCYLNYLSLFVENGVPYVFYRDASANNSGSVKKFNGSAWIDVGNADFTAQGIDTITLYVKNSIPYVLFCDSANGYRTTAMELIGNYWQIIGNAGFSTMSVYVNFGMDYSPLSLIMHNNILYAGFNDGGSMTVMQLNGSTWTPVGYPRFTDSNILPYFEKLDFMGDNPCVMFSDFNNITTSYVMTYNGLSWQTIASEVFNQMTITNFSLDPNSSIPYVAFRDQNNSYKLSVRKYDCP